MADSLKRITKAKDKQFQDRVSFYMWQKANDVMDNENPDVNDLALAKAVIARQVNVEDMTMVVITNGTIGGSIDSDTAVPDSAIEYVVDTENKFHDLETAYKAAGII